MASTLKYERVDMQSAQVISKITDLSRIESTTPDYAAVAVITAPKGPMNVATLLETTDDLIKIFGIPTSDFIQLLGVYKILENGVPVWVVRVADPLFVNTSTALIPPSDASVLFTEHEGFVDLASSKTHAGRDELLATTWFSERKESGPDAGEYVHPFPSVVFLPDLVKEEQDDTSTPTKLNLTVLGTTELEEVGEPGSEVKTFNLGLKFKLEVKTQSPIVISEFDLEKLKATITVGAEETEVEISKLMTDKGASLLALVNEGSLTFTNGQVIEIVTLAEQLPVGTTATEVVVTLNYNSTPIDLTAVSSTLDVITNIEEALTVIDAVGRFSMKEEGSYGDYNTISVIPLPSTGKTVEILQKTYPKADPNLWVNVRIVNTQTGIDENTYCSLDEENLGSEDIFIENMFSMNNEDTVAIFDWLDSNKTMSSKVFSFKDGNDGNVNIEKEVVNIYITDEETGTKQLVSHTSPAYGYIDEAGNLTGMHVFLNKKIKAQAFPSLGLCETYTYEAMKTIADEREDLNCFFDTEPNLTEDQVILAVDNACNSSEILSNQAFNCRVFWDWCYSTVMNTEYLLPPSIFVTVNSINTWKNYGAWIPVAGYTHGVIDVNNVSTKLPRVSSRDRLVSHRINPIYDTGNHGIQIYGNETLNYEYTDLRSAHIGSALTYIRSKIDTYTETLKFKLNTPDLWRTWENYVTQNILNPIITAGGLQFGRARMGAQFTTPEELAKRQVRGVIELQFTQDAEIFLLNYIVYASSADTETL